MNKSLTFYLNSLSPQVEQEMIKIFRKQPLGLYTPLGRAPLLALGKVCWRAICWGDTMGDGLRELATAFDFYVSDELIVDAWQEAFRV